MKIKVYKESDINFNNSLDDELAKVILKLKNNSWFITVIAQDNFEFHQQYSKEDEAKNIFLQICLLPKITLHELVKLGLVME